MSERGSLAGASLKVVSGSLRTVNPDYPLGDVKRRLRTLRSLKEQKRAEVTKP